jgi:hypothetical protein
VGGGFKNVKFKEPKMFDVTNLGVFRSLQTRQYRVLFPISSKRNSPNSPFYKAAVPTLEPIPKPTVCVPGAVLCEVLNSESFPLCRGVVLAWT